MIKAIIFDYGNVIERLDNSIFTERVSSFSIFDSNAIFKSIFEENIIQKKYETGLINSEEFFHSISELCKLNIQIDDFRKAYTEIFTPVPETIELIKHLKKKYKIGLISNTSEWDYEYAIKKNEIFDLFDTVSLSFKIKAMKPDEKIFFDSIKKLSLNPEECIYIDDIKEYSNKASELGMTGIHFENEKKLINDLKNIIPL